MQPRVEKDSEIAWDELIIAVTREIPTEIRFSTLRSAAPHEEGEKRVTMAIPRCTNFATYQTLAIVAESYSVLCWVSSL